MRILKSISSIGLLVLFLCSACVGRSGNAVGSDDGIQESDTIALVDSFMLDSLEQANIPVNLDETFDDFVYTYASDKRFQLHRTHFPLPFIEDSVRSSLQRSDWIHDALYAEQEFYNMLFDSEEDMEYEKKTDIDRVNVAWLFLDKQRMRKYDFRRVEGRWMLLCIEETSLGDDPNKDFLDFFHKFCNDSVFQREHIESPLKFVTSDPDDDFKVMEAFISVDQWFAFRPPLPKTRMTNINYGQPYNVKTRQKIVTFRGIGSGYGNTLFFTRHRGTWKLSGFEDMSN